MRLKSLIILAALAFAVNGYAAESCRLKIEGMSCLDCAQKVTTAAKEVCAEFKVDHQTGLATCILKGKTTPQQVVQKINTTSFKATLVN